MSQPTTPDLELALARARLHQVVLASNTVIYMLRLDRDGPQVDWVSENAERLTGYSEAEVRAEGFFKGILHPDEAERILAKQAALAEHGEQSLEYRALRKNGEYVWVRDSRRLLRDRSGRARYIVGAMIDISDRKSLEARLLEAQRLDALGRVVGGIAHDFNNILTTIIATSSAALAKSDVPADLREDFSVVLAAGRRAAELTRQMLAFGRRQMIRLEPLDVNAAVAKILPVLQRTAGPGVDVRAELAAIGTIEADSVQLEQVLLNLVVNARDAMPNGGAITVSTRTAVGLPSDTYETALGTQEEFCVLEVRDTGIGMDARTREQIFEPFFTTKSVGQGSGLGLATVFAIVQQSGGHIFVQSAPNEGSSFSVYFRRVRDTAEASELALAMAPGNETVLVVEDEAPIRTLICRFLRDAGYHVLEAGNGAEGLRVLEQNRASVDLVLTDIVMPEVTGIDFVAQVRSWYPDMRALFISGYSKDLVEDQGALPPGTEFMAKPFELSDLVQRVRQMLDRP